MRPSFVHHSKPFLCSVITEETPENSIYAIRTSEFDGAEAYLFDLRQLQVKYHNKEDLSRIFLSTDKPLMVYYYRGRPHLPQVSDEDRAESYLLSVEAGASAVDVIADLYEPSPLEICKNPAIIARQQKLIEEIRRRGGEAMLTSHTNAVMSTAQVLEHAKALEDRGPDMLKIVSRADSEDALLEALRTTAALKRQLKIPYIYISAGDYGKIQRIVGPMLGSALTFCVPYYNKDSTLEQPLLRATRQVYNNFNWKLPRRLVESGN